MNRVWVILDLTILLKVTHTKKTKNSTVSVCNIYFTVKGKALAGSVKLLSNFLKKKKKNAFQEQTGRLTVRNNHNTERASSFTA